MSDLSVAAQALGQIDTSNSATSGPQVVERFVAAYNQAITASQAGASSDTATSTSSNTSDWRTQQALRTYTS